MERKKIVVCGATGNQGGAVVKNLLKNRRWDVYAITRNPEAIAAQQLGKLGATVIKADTANYDSLLQAFENAYGVFGVTQPWSPDYKKCNIRDEIRQGENIIRAASHANVQHFVLSSIINFDDAITGAPHVDSKLKLEAFLKQRQLPYTIIRCAQFMDNIGSEFFPVKGGKIKGFIKPTAKVPYIACEDIGKYVAGIFANRESYLNLQHNLIGDSVSGIELAQIVSGLRAPQKFSYSAVPSLVLRVFAKEFYAMRRMFEKLSDSQEGSLLLTETRIAQAQMQNPLSVEEFLLKNSFAYKPL